MGIISLYFPEACRAPVNAEPISEAAESRHSNTFLRLRKKIERSVGEAIADFNMIEEGDVVMVCMSGGKDSYSLLSALMALRSRAPVSFRLIAMNLDQKQPGFPEHILPDYLASIGVEFRIVTEDTYSIVRTRYPRARPPAHCARVCAAGSSTARPGSSGATKIALGHHRDDIIETLFLNMFFGGRIKAMPPKLLSDDGQHMVIRPLAYCAERDLSRFARGMAYPIIPCNLCGSQENAQRKQIKAMLEAWQSQYPGRIESIFTSLRNVVPSHLADEALFGFKSLAHGAVIDEGDTVFDPVDPVSLAQPVRLVARPSFD